MKKLALLVVFFAIAPLSVMAEDYKFSCKTVISACEKKDSSAPYPLCKLESLLEEQVLLTCPEGMSTVFPLDRFSFHKKLQIIYTCSSGQTLNIVLSELIGDAGMGRVLNFSTTPITTPFLQQFSTLIEDNPPGDKRIIFDLSCMKLEKNDFI